MKNLSFTLILLLIFALGCNLGNITKRNFTDFDPYKGSLSELLPAEMNRAGIKFKSQGTRDTTADFTNVKEAKAFTYNQEGAGVIIPVDGALINFNNSAAAHEQLRKSADGVKGTIKTEGKNLSFTAENGKVLGWTKGSLVCLVKSNLAKPVENFKETVPF
jgi:glutamine phosphoribosylpyrophosphate amidotransferase